jgi:cysteine desulfurase
MPDHVYLDYAATTPVDPRVLEAMLPYFSGDFGNTSSIHHFGRRAEQALDQARRDVAEVLNCSPDEIIFTGCGSEADNLALRGTALARREASGARHLITSPVEHAAVLSTARQLRDHFGFDLTVLPVDAHGRVSVGDVERALRPDTALVSVMYAANEIGTVQPVAEIGAVCRAHGVPFHTDAVQAASQLDVDVRQLDVDLLALGAHKFYGPKGVGVLFIRAGTPLLPAQTGGSHERGLRAGTHNTPYIVGLAAALKITAAERDTHNARFRALRDRLISGVLGTIPGSALTGHPTERLPNHASFVFDGVDGNELLMHLDMAGIAASSGSACKTGDPEPSEVLLALGLDRRQALGSLRLTVGRPTTEAEVDLVLAVLPGVVNRLREMAVVSG